MLIPGEVWVALTSAGVSVRQLSEGRIELTITDGQDAGESWTVHVKRWARPLTPSLVSSAAAHTPNRPMLAIAPTISTAAEAAARQCGWSVIAINPHKATGPTGVLLSPGGRAISVPLSDAWHPEQEVAGNRPPPRKRGRPGYGRSNVLRLLLAGRPLTQSELGRATGLSQPRISQTLGQLKKQGLISEFPRRNQPGPSQPGPSTWAPDNWDRLLDHWLREYPGPGGTRTFWFTLNDVVTSATTLLEYLDTQALQETNAPVPRHQPVLSGPAAADRIAPWARPSTAIIYSSSGSDLQLLDLTPAAPQEANIQLVVPADPGVYLLSEAWPELAEHHIADPLQVLWDLLQDRVTPDADQAALHLRRHLAKIVRESMP